MDFKQYPWWFSTSAFRFIRIKCLLDTAAGIMTTSCKHIPSKLLVQVSAGILLLSTFEKQNRKIVILAHQLLLCSYLLDLACQCNFLLLIMY